MPLAPFQRKVAHLLAKNRNPESHFAGGSAINRGASSIRISDDLDIFHDVAASVAASAEADGKALTAAGFSIAWTFRGEGIVRAEVTLGMDRVRLDWTTDSAFRFFPVLPDEDFGYCLHPADLATNKVLALAGRTEIRDFLDTLYLNHTYLGLGAMVWAACGKDQGYTPVLLLDQANRHSRFQQANLEGENLVKLVDLKDLKLQWLAARDQAERLFEQLPPEEIGCLYLDKENNPVTPVPGDPGFAVLTRHHGSIRGAWPRIS